MAPWPRPCAIWKRRARWSGCWAATRASRRPFDHRPPPEVHRHAEQHEAEPQRAVGARRVLGQEVARDEARHHEIRSEEHTSELQSQSNLVCRLLLEKKKKTTKTKRLNTRKCMSVCTRTSHN